MRPALRPILPPNMDASGWIERCADGCVLLLSVCCCSQCAVALCALLLLVCCCSQRAVALRAVALSAAALRVIIT